MKNLPHPDNKYLEATEGWLGLGDQVSANEELEHISPAFRNNPLVLEMRWKIYVKAEKWELAAEVGRIMSEILPDSALGFIHYAYSLHELKRPQEAYAVLIPVVAKFSDSTIRYNLACYSCQLGNLEEAWQWLQKAIELSGRKDVRLIALVDPDLQPLWSKIEAL
jgi:predicted Zn-dependent protease